MSHEDLSHSISEGCIDANLVSWRYYITSPIDRLFDLFCDSVVSPTFEYCLRDFRFSLSSSFSHCSRPRAECPYCCCRRARSLGQCPDCLRRLPARSVTLLGSAICDDEQEQPLSVQMLPTFATSRGRGNTARKPRGVKRKNSAVDTSTVTSAPFLGTLNLAASQEGPLPLNSSEGVFITVHKSQSSDSSGRHTILVPYMVGEGSDSEDGFNASKLCSDSAIVPKLIAELPLAFVRVGSTKFHRRPDDRLTLRVLTNSLEFGFPHINSVGTQQSSSFSVAISFKDVWSFLIKCDTEIIPDPLPPVLFINVFAEACSKYSEACGLPNDQRIDITRPHARHIVLIGDSSHANTIQSWLHIQEYICARCSNPSKADGSSTSFGYNVLKLSTKTLMETLRGLDDTILTTLDSINSPAPRIFLPNKTPVRTATATSKISSTATNSTTIQSLTTSHLPTVTGATSLLPTQHLTAEAIRLQQQATARRLLLQQQPQRMLLVEQPLKNNSDVVLSGSSASKILKLSNAPRSEVVQQVLRISSNDFSASRNTKCIIPQQVQPSSQAQSCSISNELIERVMATNSMVAQTLTTNRASPCVGVTIKSPSLVQCIDNAALKPRPTIVGDIQTQRPSFSSSNQVNLVPRFAVNNDIAFGVPLQPVSSAYVAGSIASSIRTTLSSNTIAFSNDPPSSTMTVVGICSNSTLTSTAVTNTSESSVCERLQDSTDDLIIVSESGIAESQSENALQVEISCGTQGLSQLRANSGSVPPTQHSLRLTASSMTGSGCFPLALKDGSALLVTTTGNVQRTGKFLLHSLGSGTAIMTESSSAEACGTLLPVRLQPSVQYINRFVYSPSNGNGVTINNDDIMCLNPGEFLNDVVVDFYMKYLYHEVLTEEQRKRTFMFNSFFYKRLTFTKLPPKDPSGLSMSKRRHNLVAKWTKRVNVFEKDFIVMPINENSHWFLAIICFAWMGGVVNYSQLFNKEGGDGAAVVTLAEQFPGTRPQLRSFIRGPNDTIQMPCILMFDSLIGTCRSPNVRMLRDWMQEEWNIKMRSNHGNKSFDKDTVRGFSPKVPQQPNFYDCGPFVLHYAEMFFRKPVKQFTKQYFQSQMVEWFNDVEAQDAKRAHIQDLIIEIYRKQLQNNPLDQSLSTVVREPEEFDKQPEDEDVVIESTCDNSLIEIKDSCQLTATETKIVNIAPVLRTSAAVISSHLTHNSACFPSTSQNIVNPVKSPLLHRSANADRTLQSAARLQITESSNSSKNESNNTLATVTHT